MSTAFILDAVRTPRGRGKAGKGALSGIHPQILLAQTLQALASRSGIDRKDVEDVVIGCVSQAGEQGANIARNALLFAEWPDEVTGVTLNRFCGSGLQAVNFAAMGVMSGQQQVAIGGGVESMSRCPMGSDGAGIDGGNELLREKVHQVPQGISADLIATLEGFSREDLDRFALASQMKAEAARKDGRFRKSLVAVQDPRTGQIALEQDEHPRPDTTLEKLAKLKPAFAKDDKGTVTAGNSSGINDGAAALLIVEADRAKKLGLEPIAFVGASASAGVDPAYMGLGPVPASQKALKRAGLTMRDINVVELNEAFAVQCIAVMRELGMEPGDERLNPKGGAIAIGHPLGMSGARIATSLVHEMQRTQVARGLATACIGVGQGLATVFHRE